jgi:ethanolamine utilization protein EutQ (cupin superfamily)
VFVNLFLYLQVFCIEVGELTVTIHETEMKVRKGDIFFVPKGKSVSYILNFHCYLLT